MVDNKDSSVNIRNKNAICYIPLVAFFLHFSEAKKTPELKKHIKYAVIIFIAYAILNVVIWWVFWPLLFLVYLWISWFLWYKAYLWKKVDIDFIDKNFDNDDKKKSSDKKDDDILNF